jgi:hypothetical protein
LAISTRRPCPKTGAILLVFATGLVVRGQPIPGNVEPRGHVSLAEFAGLQDCFTGPNTTPHFEPPTRPDCRSLFDRNRDGDIDLGDFASLHERTDADVDLRDVARLQLCFGGSGPGCADAIAALDIDGDADVDLADFKFLRCAISGPDTVLPAVKVSKPPPATTSGQIQITGTSAGWPAVEILGGAAAVTVPVQNCAFVATVPLQTNRLNRLFFTGKRPNGAASAPGSVAVLQDGAPPTLFIDFPAEGAELTTAATDVAGRVGDMLSGFMGLTVQVDGLSAVVDVGIGNNGTFLATNVPLALGSNTVTAVATDALGNVTEKHIQITRVQVPPDTPTMHVVSGNRQTARIGGLLSSPIVVQVTDRKGVPLANKLVTFHVIRSNGRLTADGQGAGSLMFQTFTDASGEAQAFWRLGDDAGCGNNRVEVTSASVVGTTMFCASANPGVPRQINVGSGNNQRAEVNAPAPGPLRAWISDSCNGGRNVAVTFSVVQGGGKVNGQTRAIVPTSQTGHAEVDFTLGPFSGNNIVEADFPGNSGLPATFVIFGLLRNESEPTRFTGLVLDNANQPIQGATCTLTVGGVTLPTIESDIDGRFNFDDIPTSGLSDLRVYGYTAFHVGGPGGTDVAFGSFPSLQFLPLTVVPNALNSLPTPVRLPPLNPNNVKQYSTTQDTELTVEDIEGLRMVVKARSMKIRDTAGNLVAAPDGIPIYLNQVHHDAVPMPIPDGAAPQFTWTLQPGGAHFDPPVAITYPNMSGLPAGAIANFLSFDHDTNKFEIVASGHVTDDGQFIVTDPGAGISVAGWGCNCPPYSVTGDCDFCPSAMTDTAAGDCCPPCSAGNCEVCVSGGCANACVGCQSCNNGACVSNCPPCNECLEDGACHDFCLTCQTCVDGGCESACPPCFDCSADGTCNALCRPGCDVCEGGNCVEQCPPCQTCLENIDGSFGCSNICLACETCQNGACTDTCVGTVCCGGGPGVGTCCDPALCVNVNGELQCGAP